MDKSIPNSYFKFISFNYKFRDFFLPRMNILKEVGIICYHFLTQMPKNAVRSSKFP